MFSFHDCVSLRFVGLGFGWPHGFNSLYHCFSAWLLGEHILKHQYKQQPSYSIDFGVVNWTKIISSTPKQLGRQWLKWSASNSKPKSCVNVTVLSLVHLQINQTNMQHGTTGITCKEYPPTRSPWPLALSGSSPLSSPQRGHWPPNSSSACSCSRIPTWPPMGPRLNVGPTALVLFGQKRKQSKWPVFHWCDTPSYQTLVERPLEHEAYNKKNI